MELKKIHVAPGFLLLLAVLFVYRDIAAAFIAAAVAHELGHILAMLSFSARIKSIELNICGAVIEYDDSGLSYGQEAVCTAAGPAVSLLFAAATAAAGRISGNESCYVIAGANMALLLFNMLPVSILDGGRLLNLMLTASKGPVLAYRICFCTDIIFSSMLFVFSACMLLCGKINATLLCVSAVMLILCCKKEEGSVKS